MIELADSSVWGKLHALRPSEQLNFTTQIVNLEVATCALVLGEVLFSTRGHDELAETRDRMRALLYCPIREAQFERAHDVMDKLARGGHHRQAAFVDCVIAAAAEASEVGIVHYDADFDAIAAVTGQPVRAIAPIGSL